MRVRHCREFRAVAATQRQRSRQKQKCCRVSDAGEKFNFIRQLAIFAKSAGNYQPQKAEFSRVAVAGFCGSLKKRARPRKLTALKCYAVSLCQCSRPWQLRKRGINGGNKRRI